MFDIYAIVIEIQSIFLETYFNLFENSFKINLFWIWDRYILALRFTNRYFMNRYFSNSI